MITNISLLSVWVKDIDESLAFYTDVLGFEVGDDLQLGPEECEGVLAERGQRNLPAGEGLTGRRAHQVVLELRGQLTGCPAGAHQPRPGELADPVADRPLPGHTPSGTWH